MEGSQNTWLTLVVVITMHILVVHSLEPIQVGGSYLLLKLNLNSMELVIPLHSLYGSIHTKDESKLGTAFAFVFGVY